MNKVLQLAKNLNLLHFYVNLAKVPGADWVNLQPAEHLLFCQQFSKMFPSTFSVLGLPGRRRGGQN